MDRGVSDSSPCLGEERGPDHIDRSFHPRSCQFVEAREIRCTKVVGQCAVHDVDRVDEPGRNPAPQRFGRKVDENDVARAHEFVRYRLDGSRSRDASGVVAHGEQVGNIDGREDTEAGCKEFTDILPTSANPIGVGVREFVDEDDIRLLRDDRDNVELLERSSVTVNRPGRDDLEVSYLCSCLRPAMALEPTNDDVLTGSRRSPTFVEHRVGLAHTGRSSEEGTQPDRSIERGVLHGIHDAPGARGRASTGLPRNTRIASWPPPNDASTTDRRLVRSFVTSRNVPTVTVHYVRLIVRNVLLAAIGLGGSLELR